MASLARDKTDRFRPLSKGTHLAICNAVVDIGLQPTIKGYKEYVWLRFEVPAELSNFVSKCRGFVEPKTIWTRYTKTLHEKARLRRDLEACRGRRFHDEELDGFDLFKLVGKSCQIVVVHNVVEDRTIANVQSISVCHKSQRISQPLLSSIRVSPHDLDDFDQLPDWMQKRFDKRILEPVSTEVIPIVDQADDRFYIDDSFPDESFWL